MTDREAEGEVSRSRVAEWEEPRHPGTASQESKYPTSSHSATQNPPDVPHRLIRGLVDLRNVVICSEIRVGRISCSSTGVLQVWVHRLGLHASLPVSGCFASRWGAKWEEMASACREGGNERRGDQQQHRRDEQQRHHELNLW